jgi:hypothetical protein
MSGEEFGESDMGGESCEEEMDFGEEFSFEEDGESYIEYPSDDDEEVPKLVPGGLKSAHQPEDMIEFAPESSEDEVDEDEAGSKGEQSSDYSDIPTSELEEYEEENAEDNPHGFMYASRLDTYKKNKRERLE